MSLLSWISGCLSISGHVATSLVQFAFMSLSISMYLRTLGEVRDSRVSTVLTLLYQNTSRSRLLSEVIVFKLAGLLAGHCPTPSG